jgi:hypothetical protein
VQHAVKKLDETNFPAAGPTPMLEGIPKSREKKRKQEKRVDFDATELRKLWKAVHDRRRVISGEYESGHRYFHNVVDSLIMQQNDTDRGLERYGV